MSISTETRPRSPRAPLPRITFLVVAGLMVFSTVLFLAGTAIERGGLRAQALAETHQETTGGSETHPDEEATPLPSGEGAETQGSHLANEAEAPIFGLSMESPWVFGAVAIGTVLLIAALYYFGYPILVLVLVVAVASAVLDVRETIHQIAVANVGLVVLAGVVALAHVALAIATSIALRGGRPAPSQATSSR